LAIFGIIDFLHLAHLVTQKSFIYIVHAIFLVALFWNLYFAKFNGTALIGVLVGDSLFGDFMTNAKENPIGLSQQNIEKRKQ
jgi:hypothetical protein